MKFKRFGLIYGVALCGLNVFAAPLNHDASSTSAEDKDDIDDALVFETIPGAKAQKYLYNPSTKKCEDFLDDDGVQVKPRFYQNDSLQKAPLGYDGDEEPEKGALIVVNTLYEQLDLKNRQFIVVRDAAQLDSGEDVLLCIRHADFFKLTGQKYVHKAIYPVSAKDSPVVEVSKPKLPSLPKATPAPTPSPAPLSTDKVEYRSVTVELNKVRSLMGASNSTFKKGEEIGIISTAITPIIGKTPVTVTFFRVNDKSIPRSIFTMDRNLLMKSSKAPGEAEHFDPLVPTVVEGTHTETQAAAVAKSEQTVRSKIESDPKGSYIDQIKRKIRDPKTDFAKEKVGIGFSKVRRPNGYLVQFPFRKDNQAGPCGSYHYSPGSVKGADTFAAPTTACLFAAALQDWRSICPSGDSGCRIAFGDMSHTSINYRSSNWPHSSHNNGNCIDVRPTRKGNFQDAGLRWGSGTPIYKKTKRGKRLIAIKNRKLNSEYDQDTMIKLVDTLKKWGATTVLFNDNDKCGTTPWTGHDDHIHVCFDESTANKNKCINEFRVDPKLCPELATANLKDPASPWLYERTN